MDCFVSCFPLVVNIGQPRTTVCRGAHNILSNPCRMTRLLAPAVRMQEAPAQTVRMTEDARMLATATCTEEKFSWEPPLRVTLLGPAAPAQATRVALFPGTRTVETGFHLDNFVWSDHMPGLVDVDFTIPGKALFSQMIHLEYGSDTYMTVRTGVAPACIRTLCNTSYVRIRINTTSPTE